MEQAAIWEAASDRIRDELGWLRTDPWLEQLRLRSLERGVLYLEAGSSALRSAALGQSDAITAAVRDIVGRSVQLRVVISRKSRSRPRKSRVTEPIPEDPLEAERVNFKHQLNSFLTGPNNELALRFAQQAVEAPGHWHPMVFYGDTGCGKTHLLQGIVNAYRRRYPGRRAIYSSSDRFSRHFVQSRRKKQTRVFRQLYREVDLLAIDDLQDLAGKQGTESELNHTLDTLDMAKCQVVVSCPVAPKRIAHLDRGLEGRLLGGQVVELKTPDRATRLEIVRARSAASRLDLEPDAMDLLVGGFELNVREILCALTRLEAHQRHMSARLSEPLVREILSDLLDGRQKPATLDSVAEFVAQRLGVKVDQLRSRSRKPSLVRARQIAMALIRELCPITLREVGAFFGNRSCASVHFAQQRARELRTEDPQVRDVWDAGERLFERTERQGSTT